MRALCCSLSSSLLPLPPLGSAAFGRRLLRSLSRFATIFCRSSTTLVRCLLLHVWSLQLKLPACVTLLSSMHTCTSWLRRIALLIGLRCGKWMILTCLRQLLFSPPLAQPPGHTNSRLHCPPLPYHSLLWLDRSRTALLLSLIHILRLRRIQRFTTRWCP